MSYGDYDDSDWLEDEEKPRDPKIDEVKEELLDDLFIKEPDGVFYQRQLEIRYERKFFHWITAKALNELAEEKKINAATRPYAHIQIRFYWSRRNRYWTRRANDIAKLVLRFSEPEFSRGLGRHGEIMFDAALPHGGFLPRAKNVKDWDSKIWTRSNHDLDRIFSADGIDYGVEIKNTLSYIPHLELRTKLNMCEFFGVVPLFIMRMAPASYIQEIRLRGGFTLIFEWQLYPFGQENFAAEVRDQLGLKVGCPNAIEDGTIQRFRNWHEKKLQRKSGEF
jgi:hypothetical protein